MNFGLRHIRYFIAVAEELHFSRAAEKLGIAQPALSKAILVLENELSVRLFHRSNRHVQITEAGQTFLDGCRNAMNLIEQSAENTQRAHSGQIGTLRIGYTDNAMAGSLPQILKAFQDVQPGLVLKPHHDVSNIQLKKLDEGELEIGFVTGPINRSGLNQCLVQSEKFVCVVYKDHPLANRKTVRLEELAKQNFVHGSSKDWEHFHSYLLPLCRRAGFVPKVIQEAFNTAGILGLVSCGMGITVLTESISKSGGTGLTVIPIQDMSEELQTMAIWKSDTMDGTKKRFVDFLQQGNDLPV